NDLFFQAEDGIRGRNVTGVQTCALPISGRHILRMQKTLTQMNLQLANVLTDISGATGQAIIKAILAGERDPHKLAEFRDPRVKEIGRASCRERVESGGAEVDI